jgi:hypothetical protein
LVEGTFPGNGSFSELHGSRLGNKRMGNVDSDAEVISRQSVWIVSLIGNQSMCWVDGWRVVGDSNPNERSFVVTPAAWEQSV